MTDRTPLTAEQLKKLQEEIQPLTAGFDLIADHVIITDLGGIIIYANKAAEKHTGFSHDEMIGKNTGELWGGKMDQRFFEDMWRTIKEWKLPYKGEVQNRKKNGVDYWQELRIFPVLDEAGDLKFFIGMEPDITQRKVFEGHRDQYLEELERLNAFLSEKAVKLKELEEALSKFKKY